MERLSTHYDNLQVSQQATTSVIRAAFKALSQKWHPDKHPNNQKVAYKKFARIRMAYDVLSDAKLRQQYDLEIKRLNRRATDRQDNHTKLSNHYATKQSKTSISIIV